MQIESQALTTVRKDSVGLLMSPGKCLAFMNTNISIIATKTQTHENTLLK